MLDVLSVSAQENKAILFSSFSITANKSFRFSFRHRYIGIFINAYVDTHHFVFIVHPGDDTKCRTKSSQMGKKIYKLLKEK